MTEKKLACVHCDRTDEVVPLVSIIFKGESLYICSEHLPVLIHKPHMLTDKLAGFEPAEG